MFAAPPASPRGTRINAWSFCDEIKRVPVCTSRFKLCGGINKVLTANRWLFVLLLFGALEDDLFGVQNIDVLIAE